MPATTTHRWTRADLVNLPDDGNRYEVLDGSLFVTPAPTVPHQLIGPRLLLALMPYVERHGLGGVFGPGAIAFGDSELQPDVLVTPFPAGALPEDWADMPRPLLVVEILSSSTRRRDLGVKRKAYLRLGIPDYWVIDRFERRALCWTPGSDSPIVVTDELRWQPAPATEPLVIRLEEFLPPQNA